MTRVHIWFGLLLLASGAHVLTKARVVSFDKTIDHNLRESKAKLVTVGNVGTQNAARNYTPVVFWHGMGDSAYGSVNIDRMALQKKFPGMNVYSIQIGSSSVEDQLMSYFSNINIQISQACEALLTNDEIRRAGELNAVGFSQGAQFLRALVQRCPLSANGIRVKNLISIGGQHQGVFGLPSCSSVTFCDYIRHMLTTGAYEQHVQDHLVQAQYWHDPLQESTYRNKNVFLPDINNENHINQTYRNRLLALENLVLIQFLDDEMVVPRESSLFGFYAPGQNQEIRPLEKSPLFLEDRLGLKKLQESGRLRLMKVPGRHLHYSMSWFLDEIGTKYLSN